MKQSFMTMEMALHVQGGNNMKLFKLLAGTLALGAGACAVLGKVKKARTAYSLLAKIAYYGIADPSIKKEEVIKKLKKENRENWRTLITAPIGIRRKIIVTSFAISYYFTELIIHCVSTKHKK